MPQSGMMLDPQPHQLRLVVLVDDVQINAFVPIERLNPMMDSLEDMMKIDPNDRGDRIRHMEMRQWVAERLHNPSTMQKTFDNVGGAMCLWLALRHYERGDMLRKAVDQRAHRGCVLTASIGDSEGALPGTAWSFIVAGDVQDGRTALAQNAPDQLKIINPDGTEDLVKFDLPS